MAFWWRCLAYLSVHSDARHVSPEVRYQKHKQITDSGVGLHFLTRFGLHLPYGGARSYISDRYFLGGVSSFRYAVEVI